MEGKRGQVVDGVGHMMQTITSLNTKDELGKATTNIIQGNRFKLELGGGESVRGSSNISECCVYWAFTNWLMSSAFLIQVRREGRIFRTTSTFK